MAVARQFNFLGQQRLDVPHFRLLESGVAGDFDSLAGKIIAGQQPGIVAGFNVSTTNAYGAQTKALKVVVSGAAILHYGASESGSVFTVPAGTTPEVLDPVANAKVIGSFAAGATNYVGLDLVRTVDDATADLVQFLDATTKKETPKSVALARVLSYRFAISTKSFTSSPNLAPLAIVVVDPSGNVTQITDARKMLFRLGTGGDVPNALNTYTAWGVTAGTRRENPITSTSADPFAGGDKGFASFKDWMNGIMTRLWEIGGGEFWYSPTADRDVILTRSGTTLDDGDYLKWDGTNLTWQGLSFVFANSTGNTNQVKDQATALAGTTDLAVGDCLFVDLDRTQNLTGGSALSPIKGSLSAVGPATTRPGSRIVMAWRTASGVFARGLPYPVGTVAPPATPIALGIVKLASAFGGSAVAPEVPTMDASSGSGTLAKVLGGGLTRGTTTAGNIDVGTGANDNTVNISRVGQTTAIGGNATVAGTFASGNLSAGSGTFTGAISAASATITGALSAGSVSFSTLDTASLDHAGEIAIGTVSLTGPVRVGKTGTTNAYLTVPSGVVFSTDWQNNRNQVAGASLCKAWGTFTALRLGSGSSQTLTQQGSSLAISAGNPGVDMTINFQTNLGMGTDYTVLVTQINTSASAFDPNFFTFQVYARTATSFNIAFWLLNTGKINWTDAGTLTCTFHVAVFGIQSANATGIY